MTGRSHGPSRPRAGGAFFSWALSWVLLAACPGLAGPALAADDGAVLRFDSDAARFSGDYGGTEEITFDVLTVRLRSTWRRGSLRLSLPWLRLSTDEARLVGGVPTPGQGPPPGMASRSVSGGGDVRVRGDLDLLAGTATRPWITALAEVKLPTADEEKGLGTGEPDTALGLAVLQPVGRSHLLLEARHAWLGDPPGMDFEDVISLGAGLSRTVGPRGGGTLLLYFENRTHPVTGREDRRDLFGGGTASLGAARRVRLTGGVFAGLSDTAEDWGVSLGLGVIVP